MSEGEGGGGGGGAYRYTFNSHRDALYKVLEAAARGQPGYDEYCADECDCDDSNNNLGKEKGGEGQKPSAYPTPFLWYEEIRPSDIDAYHAANRAQTRCCTSGCNNSSSGRSSKDDPPLSRTPPPITSSGAAGSNGEFHRSRVALNAAAAGEGGEVVLEGGLRSAPPSITTAAVNADRASEFEPAAAAAAAAVAAASAVVHVVGEKQEGGLSGSGGGALARAPGGNLGATVSSHPSCTKHRCRYRPDGTAAGMRTEEAREEEEDEEGECAPPTTGRAASMDVVSNADAEPSFSEAGENKEKESCCPSLTMTTAAAAAVTTPPDSSQATQTMFLPGLPSQVLVTQQSQQQQQQQQQPQWEGDAGGWEHSEGNESPLREEEDTPVSEYALSLPNNHDRPLPFTQENASTGASAATSGGDRQPSGSDFRNIRPEPDRNESCSSSSDPLVVAGESAAAAREREEEARSRQYDAFTIALKDFVGREEQRGRRFDGQLAGSAQSAPRNVSGGGGTSSSSSSSSSGGRGNDRSKPPFTFRSTLEVLPSGWPGGQAGVITFLEKQLSHARKRCPGGYAARALELSCHVLREPTVCVNATECRGGSLEYTRAAAARRADFVAGAATTVVDDDHPQVVGVAGFVWEMLRANGGNGANLV